MKTENNNFENLIEVDVNEGILRFKNCNSKLIWWVVLLFIIKSISELITTIKS